MAIVIDDAYFMIMTGVWKIGDMESWIEELNEEAIEGVREEIEKEAYDQGHEDGYKEAIKDARNAVDDLS